jgi:hypothetical protein
LRFNLEEAPEMRVEISVDGTKAPVPQEPVQEDRSELQGALQAVHDVMSWNHVYDFVNGRPYTALSRFWNSRKFGGFGVWLDDILFNAWLWGHFETARARDNLEAVFAWQTEAGNFPCLVTGNDAWLDRSQPPIGAFVVWSLFARSGERELLERAYPGLLRNYYWWWARRRLGDTGLICYGTSLDAGDGLYKGTKLAAKDESTMDNSPLHDSVPFDEASGLLLAADVGLNALAALDGEVLALMARTLGQDAEADELERQVAAHKARIAEWLWDETRQVFANRMLDGTFVAPLAPTSFYPLVAGIGTPEQRDALVERHLRPEDKFGGAFALPSVTRDDPAYGDNVYWRGRAPLLARLAGAPMWRELQCRDRGDRRSAGHRRLLQLGRAAARARGGRAPGHDALGRLVAHGAAGRDPPGAAPDAGRPRVPVRRCVLLAPGAGRRAGDASEQSPGAHLPGLAHGQAAGGSVAGDRPGRRLDRLPEPRERSLRFGRRETAPARRPLRATAAWRLRMVSAESRLAPAPAPLPTGMVGPCSSTGLLARWDMR